jgi:site-specific recombinase XerD
MRRASVRNSRPYAPALDGYVLAAKGMDTGRLQHYLGHASITNTVRYTAMSPEPFKDIWR